MMIQALVASLLLAIVISVLALLAPARENSQRVAMFGLLFWGASLFFWRTLPACDAHIEITEAAISQHHPSKQAVTLLWKEISQVKNNPIMQRLELYSRDKQTKINVEHQIEDFAQIKQLIESKTGV